MQWNTSSTNVKETNFLVLFKLENIGRSENRTMLYYFHSEAIHLKFMFEV